MNTQLKQYEIEQEEKAEAEKRKELEMWIGNKIGNELMKHYPRLRWGIFVDIAGQVVIIMCPILSPTKGYYLHLNKYTIHDLQKRAVRAGGEILERHGVSRHQALNLDTVEEKKTDVRGNVIAADAAPEPIKKC